MPKKVLIITYYWPPAGGPGVQRWLKFVKYLPEFNVEPIVFIPENPSYPLVDESLVSEVSNDLTILKSPIKEPYKFASFFSKKKSSTISKGIISEKNNQSLIEKVLLYIRGNYFIPDARKSWVAPSVEFLLDYIAKENIKTVVSTGPPHSLHLIGSQLKEKTGVKWLADFRDPWTTIGYHKQLKLNKASKRKHKLLEKKVLTEADQIIVTSMVTKNEFANITPKPIEVITNGYDNEYKGDVILDFKFSISHIGSLLSKRNPEILWEILGEIVKENETFSNDLQLNFIGVISDDVIQSIKKQSLSKHLNKIGYVSHKEAIGFQKKSQILLLIEINSEETKCIIPGKLFEYLISERPILALGPKDSSIEEIIKETNTGSYFSYDDREALKKEILKYYESFQSKTLKSQPVNIEKYSRKKLTEILSGLV